MSIVALKKCFLIGLRQEKQSVLEALQTLGCLHLEPLRPSEAAPSLHSRYLQAFKFLASCPRKLRPQPAVGLDLEDLTERCLALEARMRTLKDRCDFLRARIRALEPWGEFRLPEEGALVGLRLWFYQVPARQLKTLPKNQLSWQVVYRTPKLAYVVVIAEEEPTPDVWPLPRVHTGHLPLSRLRIELAQLEAEYEDCQLERQRLTRFLPEFSRHMGELEDRALRQQAADTALDIEDWFVLSAWVPGNRLNELLAWARKLGLGWQIVEPQAGELPPTLLANPKPFSSGERLVGFYQLPRYDDWDPSAAVFLAFVGFFALMLGDAGYAGVLLGLLWLLRHRLAPDVKILGGWAVGAALLWGVLGGGIFGYRPEALAPLQLFRAQDFSSLLTFSLGIGLGHLSLALGARALQNFRLGRPWLAPLGWIVAAWSGFGFWQSQGEVWQWGIGAGLGAVLVGSGERPVRKGTDVLWRLLEGLLALTKLTRLFGDVLSYLRLGALALAGSSLAWTCNTLAAQVRGSLGFGLLESILVLLVGHGLNLGLSLMGAVIHGMRLNCIEFFGWALWGEGRAFRAFAKDGERRWKIWSSL